MLHVPASGIRRIGPCNGVKRMTGVRENGFDICEIRCAWIPWEVYTSLLAIQSNLCAQLPSSKSDQRGLQSFGTGILKLSTAEDRQTHLGTNSIRMITMVSSPFGRQIPRAHSQKDE